MNAYAPTARKNMDVATFVVILMFAVSAIAFAAYVGIHDVMPHIRALLETLSRPQTPSTN